MFQSIVTNINLKLRSSTQIFFKSCIKFSTLSKKKYLNIPSYILLRFSEGRSFNRFNLQELPVKIFLCEYSDETPSIPTSKDKHIVFEDLNEHEARDILNENEYEHEENDYQHDVELNENINKSKMSFSMHEDNIRAKHEGNLDENDYDIDVNEFSSEIGRNLNDPKQIHVPEDIDLKIKMALEKLSPEERIAILDKFKADEKAEHFLNVGISDLEELICDATNSICIENFEAKISKILDTYYAIERVGQQSVSIVSKWESVLNLWVKCVSLSPELNSDSLMLLLQYFKKMGFYYKQGLSLVLQDLMFKTSTLRFKDIIALHYLLPVCDAPVRDRLWANAIFNFERNLTQQQLENIKYSNLFVMLKICLEEKLICTHMLVEEISNRGTITSSNCAISFIQIMSGLPPKRVLKYLIPPEKKIFHEIVTKECLSLIASRIEDYPVKLIFPTVLKIADAVRSGHQFLYHENFLEAVIKRALIEEWPTEQLKELAIHAFKMRYVSDELLSTLISNHYQKGHNKMTPVLISAISVMDQIPSIMKEIADRHQISIAAQLQEKRHSHSVLKESHVLNLLSFLDIGYINEKYCQLILNESYVRKAISTMKNMHRNFLLIDFILKRNYPSLSHCCLSESLKMKLFRLSFPKMRKGQSENYTDRLDFVDEFINDPTKLVSRVSYRNQLFFRKLLVVDEEGLPVQLLKDDDHASCNSSYAYEDLSINPNHKRIVFVHIFPQNVYSPDRRLKSHIRLFIKTIESEGFHVIKCFEDRPHDDVENELLRLGVKLSQ